MAPLLANWQKVWALRVLLLNVGCTRVMVRVSYILLYMLDPTGARGEQCAPHPKILRPTSYILQALGVEQCGQCPEECLASYTLHPTPYILQALKGNTLAHFLRSVLHRTIYILRPIGAKWEQCGQPVGCGTVA